MTDNLPAVRRPNEVATTDTDSWIQVMGPLVKLAEQVASTEFVPKQLRGKPAAVTAALLYGREVGLPPMTSLTMTHVIEGKPAMSAEAMRALVLAAGHDIEVLESTGSICRMRGRRRGSETWTPVEWTWDMARHAEVTGKDNWRHYPRQMLQARCTAELARLVFPDVIHGFRSVEELDDMGETASVEPSPPADPKTTVRRSRAAKKTPASTPPPVEAGRQRPPTPQGVPLPGEDGFGDIAGPGEVPLAGEPPAGTSSPEGASPPDPDAPSGPSPQTGAPEDPLRGAEAGADPAEAEAVDTLEPPSGAPPAPEQGAVEEDDRPERASKPQLTRIRLTFNGLGLTGEDSRDQRLTLVSRIVGRRVESTTHLSKDEASSVIDTLGRVRSLGDLEALLEATGAE